MLQLLFHSYIDVRLQQNSDADSKHDNPQTTQLVDSLMTKLNKSHEEVQEGKIKATQLAQKLEQYDLLLEEIPLLKAQVILSKVLVAFIDVLS